MRRSAENVALVVASIGLLIACLLIIFTVARFAYGWEGDDGALSQREAQRGQQMQLTEPPAPPPPARPVAVPGDCGSWRAIFAWYGATSSEIEFFFGNARPWGVSRTNIIFGESGCGLRFRNPDTSDTGICQLNGVHRGWVGSLFGLAIPNTEAGASNPDYVKPCLYLLRGGWTPNAFDGACNWRTPNFCGG